MKRLVFDIETNGLLKDASKIHCCVTLDADTREIHSYGSGCSGSERLYLAIPQLESADILIGHNIVEFDLPVINLLWSYFPPRKQSHIDTLRMARNKYPGLDGGHSLRAWYLRVATEADDSWLEYTGGWTRWSREMQEHCERDVWATLRLFEHFTSGRKP